MLTLFECKIRFEKTDHETGTEKMVTETYLFDALTYTEAEVRIHEKMPEYISGEYFIVNIRKAKYAEILPAGGGDRWYKAKVSFITIDEKAGKEKKVTQQVLVMASGIKEAFDNIVEGMNGTTDDFEVNSIAESPIIEYFPLFDKDEELKDKEIARRPADEVTE